MSAIMAMSLLVIIFLAGAWDVYVTFSGYPDATVSDIVQSWGMSYPILPLAVGVLLGHLFWPVRKP